MSNIALFSDRIVTRLKDEFQGRARVRHFPADIDAETKKPRQYAEIWVAFDGRSGDRPNLLYPGQPITHRQTYGFNLIHLNKDVRGADTDFTPIYSQIDACLDVLSGYGPGEQELEGRSLYESYVRFRALVKDFYIYEQRFELEHTYTRDQSFQ